MGERGPSRVQALAARRSRQVLTDDGLDVLRARVHVEEGTCGERQAKRLRVVLEVVVALGGDARGQVARGGRQARVLAHGLDARQRVELAALGPLAVNDRIQPPQRVLLRRRGGIGGARARARADARAADGRAGDGEVGEGSGQSIVLPLRARGEAGNGRPLPPSSLSRQGMAALGARARGRTCSCTLSSCSSASRPVARGGSGGGAARGRVARRAAIARAVEGPARQAVSLRTRRGPRSTGPLRRLGAGRKSPHVARRGAAFAGVGGEL